MVMGETGWWSQCKMSAGGGGGGEKWLIVIGGHLAVISGNEVTWNGGRGDRSSLVLVMVIVLLESYYCNILLVHSKSKLIM